MGRHLTTKEKNEIVSEVAAGKSYKDIAEAKGLHASTISRIIKRRRPCTIARMSREVSPHHSQPCPRCKKLEIALLDMIIKM